MGAELPGRALRTAFARGPVEAMADRRSFGRGLLYAANGEVGKRTASDDSVAATVRGSSSYQVRRWLEDGEPVADCSCPVGLADRFCKQAVAVALIATDAVADPSQKAEAVIDIRGYLAGLDHDALVDLLVERAAEDETLDARLRMSAARATITGPPPLAVSRNALDEAFIVRDYVDYRGVYDYASTVEEAVDALDQLLRDGHAEAVITLAEHAIDRAEDAVGRVDDSDGSMSGIAERLQQLHRDACAAARPEPIALARTLYERERHSGDLDVFDGAAATYAQILGAEGIAEYRRLATPEWDALPPLASGEEGESYAEPRFRLARIMRTLAELAGDVDAVADVLARDQSSPYQFVRIAELYREAGRYNDALAWAEKGLAMHGGSDSRLIEAAAQEYHRAGRGPDAVRVAWAAYDEEPSLRTYRQLAEQATRAGLWADWHERALTVLRERIAGHDRPAPRGRSTGWAVRGPDSSTLVEVLLHDGNVEQAWAQAGTAGCRNDLWVELARRRETDHPLDAIPIWQREIERAIDAKKNHAYARAVELIAHVYRLFNAGDREADFGPYVAKLRTAHKPKRNLMKLFDERSW